VVSKSERKESCSLHRIIRRPVFFVAETHKIGQLLREMQARRFHLAVVVDEFGGTSGVVTLEDIVEEIVGEIRDEHDREEPMVQEISPGVWSVDARISIYDLGEILGVDFEDEDVAYDSLGGMIVELADRVPDVGESVASHGFDFIVREGDEKHVTRVEIVRRSPEGEVHAAAE
jgi:putative hemolysin